jgi:hypothetical protein
MTCEEFRLSRNNRGKDGLEDFGILEIDSLKLTLSLEILT